MFKAACAAGFFVSGAAGAIGAYAGNPRGAVGLICAGLMGFVWGTLFAQVAKEQPGRNGKPPRKEAFRAYATVLTSLTLSVVAFVAGSTLGGALALCLGLAAVAPAPLGGYYLAKLAIDYPQSRARRILAPEILFRDRPRQ